MCTCMSLCVHAKCKICVHVYIYVPVYACICSGVCSCWSTIPYHLKGRFSFHWRIDRWALPWRRTFLAKTSNLELSAMQLLIKWRPWRFKLFQIIIIILKSTWPQFCLQIRASEPKAKFWVEIDTQKPGFGIRILHFIRNKLYSPLLHPNKCWYLEPWGYEIRMEWLSQGLWAGSRLNVGFPQCCLSWS